jgi:hypothetical protein
VRRVYYCKKLEESSESDGSCCINIGVRARLHSSVASERQLTFMKQRQPHVELICFVCKGRRSYRKVSPFFEVAKMLVFEKVGGWEKVESQAFAGAKLVITTLRESDIQASTSRFSSDQNKSVKNEPYLIDRKT